MPNLVNFGKGTATNEQDLIVQFNNFLVGICGWERIDVVTDTSSDRDYVYKSPGEVPGRYHDIYARWRGNSNFVTCYMYSRWGSSVDYDGQIYNSDYTYTPCYNSNFDWWAFGNLDGVWLVWVSGNNGTGTSYFSAYTGYYKSYYPDDITYQPILATGQRYDYRWFDEPRALVYHPFETSIPSTSGNNRSFRGSKDQYNYCLTYHDPSSRDGSIGHMPLVGTYLFSAHINAVWGEFLHCVYLPGNGLSSEDWVSISGTNYKYFVQKYSDDETMGYGPIDTASGTDW